MRSASLCVQIFKRWRWMAQFADFFIAQLGCYKNTGLPK
jgi:hypothetical protein